MIEIAIIFGIVYFGMMLGTLPFLKVDRSAIALIGAVALISSHLISADTAIKSVDFGTLALLFGLMLVSIQLEMSGFYAWIAARVCHSDLSPPALLALLGALSGLLSAFLTNDVIAVAFTPIVLGLCISRKLNPVPFLLVLAFSTNSGAIATFIGSPQNMLISQKLEISFAKFALYTSVPALFSLFLGWLVVFMLYRKKWNLTVTASDSGPCVKECAMDRIETIKGLAVVAVVVSLFMFTNHNRALVAIGAGAFLLLNAHFQSRVMLHKIDWNLLILFFGLFVVNGAMQETGLPKKFVTDMGACGFELSNPGIMFIATSFLSDIVSNVPAVILLLPYSENPLSGPLMAIASGLSSNLIVIGSMANIIVIDAAASKGVKISFWDFCKAGIPVGLISLAAGAAWATLVNALVK